MSVAARVAGWQRKLGGQAGPYSGASATGVSSNELVMVELLIDGGWQDITPLVMVRESGNISIRRGMSSEGANPDPGQCTLQLNNRDGRFSPNNPVGLYYGKIGRNTQIRVSVPKGDDKAYRFWGEVSQWPEDWDPTDTDRWVDITAAGLLQRLRQSTTPLHSTLYRGTVNAAVTTPPVAYWPCEDGSQATSLASATDGPAMGLVGGPPSLASDNGFNCSEPLPVMNNGEFFGTIPPYQVTGQSQVRFLVGLPTALPDNTVLMEVEATGTVYQWQVLYNTGGGITLRGIDSTGAVLASSGAIAFSFPVGIRLRMSMELTQSGGSVNWAFNTIDVVTGAVLGLSGTFASITVGRMTIVRMGPSRNLTDVIFGHVSVQNDVTNVFDLINQVIAYNGETVSARMRRLCAEERVDYADVTTFSNDKMGPQRPGQFLQLLQEGIDVDQGTFFERETALGLAFRCRTAMYNQGTFLSLAYDTGQLSNIPKPMPDAKLVQNTITASRPLGSSFTATQLTGPLSVNPPPVGVGPYAASESINVMLDSDLSAHAAWSLHLGTVDEPRYPEISINLARTELAGPVRLDALNILFGQKIAVSGVPSRLGGDLELIVIGIQETLTIFEHRITYVCVPESPYEVGIIESLTHGRVGSSASQLASDMTPTSTTVSVLATDGFPWSIDQLQMPYDVTVAGEQMSVVSLGSVLNSNPGFEFGTAGWTAVNGTVTADSSLTDFGFFSGHLVTGAGAVPHVISDQVPVIAGNTYWEVGFLRTPDILPTSPALSISWYTAAHVLISTSVGASPIPTNQWLHFRTTFVAPATAAFASILFSVTGTPGAGFNLYGDQIMLIDNTTATQISGVPQTFTVARSSNGVVKTHQSGELLTLTDPAVVSL